MSHLARTLVVALAASLASESARADVAADLKTLRERRLDELAKPAKPDEVANVLSKARPDGSFADLDYASPLVNDGWQPRMHLDRMTTLVHAYLAPGPSKGDAKLEAAALRGLDWWLAHDYQNKNWFWNQIGVPNRLTPTLLAFWDDLSAEQRSASLKILARAKVEGSGANLGWLGLVVIDRSLLTGDADSIRKAYAAIADDIKVVDKQADGAQVDNSYLYHGPLLYSWGYGIANLRDQAHVATMVAGTGFAIPTAKLALTRDWMLDGAQWMTRRQGVDFNAIGRGIARPGTQDPSPLATIGHDLLNADVGREGELHAMVARGQGDAAAPPLVGNRQFWRADFMAHQRPGWYASARLYSTRTKSAEWGNGEALRSWYLGDGCNVLMRDGDEYLDIQPVWDWQRIPGTTVELLPNFGPIAGKPDGDPLGFVPTRNSITRLGQESFVGGASDSTYGAFGGKFARAALSVRRAWFFFDDEYVALGAGLACASDNPVITTLDQRHFKSAPTVDTGATPRWLACDGVGYAFLGASPPTYKFTAGPQSGSWHDVSLAFPPDVVSQPVFKAWIEHGPRPADASFAYAVCPTTDERALAAYAAAPPVAIARNAADAQAVWHAKLRRGGAIFYEAGSVAMTGGATLAVDRPCIAWLDLSADVPAITVSNPENQPATIRVALTRGGKTTTTDVELPGGTRAGASVTRKLTP